MFMRTIIYEQIWSQEAWIHDMDQVARAIFAENEDVQWLVGQGYIPEFWQWDVVNLDQRYYAMKFRVPDPVLTHMMLLFPDYEHRKEF